MHRFGLTWPGTGAAPLAVALLLVAVAVIWRSKAPPDPSHYHAATIRMMTAMNIRPSGDVDADFVAMMVPHHQGAIDMARVELRHGRNELLRRIAQEIIVTQQDEIAVMRLALGQPLTPFASSPAPDMNHRHR